MTGSDACQQQMTTGTGNAQLTRYYYNMITRQCQQFTYRGLFGNQNNFLTQAECESSCNILINPCAEGEPASSAQGKYTLHTVCADNLNNNFQVHNFAHNIIPPVQQITIAIMVQTRTQQYAVQHVSVHRMSHRHSDIGAMTACDLPMVIGSGRDSLPRFYYDTMTRQCRQFTYTGMRGNRNNFLTQQECAQQCPGMLSHRHYNHIQ
jgi:hypothetical protein